MRVMGQWHPTVCQSNRRGMGGRPMAHMLHSPLLR